MTGTITITTIISPYRKVDTDLTFKTDAELKKLFFWLKGKPVIVTVKFDEP